MVPNQTKLPRLWARDCALVLWFCRGTSLTREALSGRLKFTVRRHKFNEDSLFVTTRSRGRRV